MTTDPWQVRVNVDGTAADVLRRAAYVGDLDGESTVYAELIRPQYQGGLFNRTRSVNQYLTHWIYPYRGKFHPQMVPGRGGSARRPRPFAGNPSEGVPGKAIRPARTRPAARAAARKQTA